MALLYGSVRGKTRTSSEVIREQYLGMSMTEGSSSWELFSRLVKLILKQFFTKTGNKKNGY